MIGLRINAILIKTSTLGLVPMKHLGKNLQEMHDHLCEIE